MRIRKRPVPLPFSSLSPVPLSDPLFLSLDDPHLHPLLVQLPLVKPHPQSIPLPIPIDPNQQLPKEEPPSADCFPELSDGKAAAAGDGADGGGVSSGHHTQSRVYPDNNAEKPTPGLSRPAVPASLSCEENKISLKKRRLSSSGDGGYDDENEMKMKTKAASLGINCGRRKGRGVGVDGSGGTGMEGSRCSRVNGRGWRCGQQTLVGYSLCEHHLGKGRLRSMMNVRTRFTIGATEDSVKGHEKLDPMDQPTGADPERSLPPGLEERSSVGYDSNEKDDYDDDEDDNSLTNRKKKARSMSSLLGQVLNHNDNAGASVVSSQVEGRCL